MKRPFSLLRLLAVAGMLTGMLVATATTASASPPPSGGLPAVWDYQTWPGLFGPTESNVAFPQIICTSATTPHTITVGGAACDGGQEVYFPAVGNGEDFGLGAAQTSVTVQNLDQDDAFVFLYVGGKATTYAYLSGGASKTFTAADLGISSGDVQPVVAALYHYLVSAAKCVQSPTGGFVCSVYDGNGNLLFTFISATDVSIGVGLGAFAAGVAKQAVAGESLPYTTAADESVSGYNAISGRELGFFDQLYFPIVQTNCGPGGCWDTILRIANFGIDKNAAVTVRFFPADDGSGSLQTGFQLQALVSHSHLWSIRLSDYVPEGWVGSAQVFTDDAVAGIADRYKFGTHMWITNTASNAQAESFWQFPGGPANAPFVLFAPDVRMDWNGWNTGIDVANTIDADNHVWIQYFGNNGNAPLAQDNTLHAQGMTYFYNPSQPSEDDCQQPASDPNSGCDFIGGAVILSEAPVAVAVDGVKYYGNDANVGQAFSYSATGNVFTNQAAPLVQKGNPADGMGATSGINFMNPNAQATVVNTYWINPSGFNASNFAPSIVWVPGYSTGFVYTMFHHNLPNGFYGSALVVSDLPISATTANVDYQVQWDGTVIWNLYNPCGFFRQSGYPGDNPDCVYQAPVSPPPPTATITKEVVCSTCDVAPTNVAGATVLYEGTTDTGFDINGSGITGVGGDIVFAVPPGTYTITLAGLPSEYDQSSVGETNTVTVAAGDAAVVTDDVSQASVTKIVDTNVPGITVCIFEASTPIPTDITVDQTGAVACDVADANGNATFTGLDAGEDYVAVAQGLGYDQVTDAFNIAVPGTTETNVLNMGQIPGLLTKAIDVSGFAGIGDPNGQFHLLSEVIFCRADRLPAGTTASSLATSGDCNDIFDAAAVAHGGVDNYFNQLTPTFEINAEVNPGQYFICWAASVSGDFDNDPTTPDTSISVPPVNGDIACEGPYTVTSGQETYVNNDFVSQTVGTLDVLVEAGDGTTDLEGINVCLYVYDSTAANGQGALIDCTLTDVNGQASFANVPFGEYAVTGLGNEGDVNGVLYEDQTAVVSYNPVQDLARCNALADDLTNEACADVDLSLQENPT